MQFCDAPGEAVGRDSTSGLQQRQRPSTRHPTPSHKKDLMRAPAPKLKAAGAILTERGSNTLSPRCVSYDAVTAETRPEVLLLLKTIEGGIINHCVSDAPDDFGHHTAAIGAMDGLLREALEDTTAKSGSGEEVMDCAGSGRWWAPSFDAAQRYDRRSASSCDTTARAHLRHQQRPARRRSSTRPAPASSPRPAARAPSPPRAGRDARTVAELRLEVLGPPRVSCPERGRSPP